MKLSGMEEAWERGVVGSKSIDSFDSLNRRGLSKLGWEEVKMVLLSCICVPWLTDSFISTGGSEALGGLYSRRGPSKGASVSAMASS